MPLRNAQIRLDQSAHPVWRALRYAYYDWTREMPRWKRLIAWCGILLQGYAIYAGITRSLIWPMIWPEWPALLASVWLLYIVGSGLTNGMLTSEFFRKTQLEADQLAAQQIQKTLHPERVEGLPGYEVETFYKPFRGVGGDYFDVVELADGRTLFAMADVSGKGMAAALLAANIQALVRSIASTGADLPALATQINRHLHRYTPSDRYATAVFVILRCGLGEIAYVNAGHNCPILASGATSLLEATGMPLGLFREAEFGVRSAAIRPGGALLLYTNGLTDSIAGQNPEERLRRALESVPGDMMANLRSLVDPKFNEDDVTILLLRRVK
jgi:phosphoserine phosphatase RsbU/P